MERENTELGEATEDSSICNAVSSGPFVALVVCAAILLVMLAS